MTEVISLISNWAIPLMLLVVPLIGFLKGVPVYEAFVEGAQEGFETAVKIIPYLVGMMVAISVFVSSGAMGWLCHLMEPVLAPLGVRPEILPLAMMRPLSGSGVLAMAADLMKTHGPDSYLGRLASTLQGTTDTTFFVLTIYFGSVGVRRYRYSLVVGLAADISGLIASIYICNRLFG